MTQYDPYQPDQHLPAPVEPAWQPQYPPSAPLPAQPMYQPYGMQPYSMPMYPMLRTSGMAVAGMVIGILALIGFWVPFADILLGFLAVGLSWAGIVQCGKPGYTGKGMAIAGLVCGILAVIPAIVVMLFFFGLFAAAGACGIAC